MGLPFPNFIFVVVVVVHNYFLRPCYLLIKYLRFASSQFKLLSTFFTNHKSSLLCQCHFFTGQMTACSVIWREQSCIESAELQRIVLTDGVIVFTIFTDVIQTCASADESHYVIGCITDRQLNTHHMVICKCQQL